ncbi:MerR family DNA-binding protein, partial [Sphingomonadaceae bacterium jetA1]|uniref:MerR family DNA-binding protein n=1 Tax=Facivitalis istanbulensis TaxID=3075838 RepID=UPI00347C2E16
HRDWSCTAVETIAREHRKAIERKIADLSALDHELAQIIEKCGVTVKKSGPAAHERRVNRVDLDAH